METPARGYDTEHQREGKKTTQRPSRHVRAGRNITELGLASLDQAIHAMRWCACLHVDWCSVRTRLRDEIVNLVHQLPESLRLKNVADHLLLSYDLTGDAAACSTLGSVLYTRSQVILPSPISVCPAKQAALRVQHLFGTPERAALGIDCGSLRPIHRGLLTRSLGPKTGHHTRWEERTNKRTNERTTHRRGTGRP